MNENAEAQVFTMTEPESGLSCMIDDAFKLAEKFPEITKMIETDQVKKAKMDKKTRLEDDQWREKQLTPFPEFGEPDVVEIEADDLELESGKKRMPPKMVLMFILIRGFLGGVKSRITKLFILESLTIHNILTANGLKMPAPSTIAANINAVGAATLQFIWDKQLEYILEVGLDDFKEMTLDSTAVSANTTWPTDSGIIAALAERIWTLGQKLHLFGISDMAKRRFEEIVGILKKCHRQISMAVGKKGSDKKRTKYYKKILKEAKKALDAFRMEMSSVSADVEKADILPSEKLRLIRVVEIMSKDVENLEKAIGQCEKRVIDKEKVKSKDKIFSVSDGNAAFIKKGQRDEVVGYKPQLGQSGKGVVTCAEIPLGNAADSSLLEPMVDQHIERTKVVPDIVSADDGYASSKGKKNVEGKGVKSVSISGSKGKKITPEKDWDSEIFKKARNDRSSVESLIFTIKYNFTFDKVMRRGIDKVRVELTEKIIVYNFARIAILRKRKIEAEREAARKKAEREAKKKIAEREAARKNAAVKKKAA